MDTLAERRLLDTSLKQLELQCTDSTVHHVFNREELKDQLLTSNELRQLLGKPKFFPTTKCLQPKDVMKDCDLTGYQLIKNRFVCKEYINKAHANVKSAVLSTENRISFLIPWATMLSTRFVSCKSVW